MPLITHEDVLRAEARYQDAIENAMRRDSPAVDRELIEAELHLLLLRGRLADEQTAAAEAAALATIPAPGSGVAPF